MSRASSLKDRVVGQPPRLLNLFVLVWGVGFAALSGWLLIRRYQLGWSLDEAGGVLICTLIFMLGGGAVIGALAQLIDRRPLARLDADGIQCHASVGPALILWDNISGASYACRRKRRFTDHYVEINLFDPQWRWRAPFRSMFVDINFGPDQEGAEAYAAMIAERIGRRAAA